MKTPISKALETVSRKKQKPTVRICGCGTPLIWTFAFAYSERYCLNCGQPTPMFDGNNDVPLTKELQLKKKLVEVMWKVIYNKYLPKGNFQQGDCKKCVGNAYHNNHLTKGEVEYDKIASKLLEKVKGFLDENK